MTDRDASQIAKQSFDFEAQRTELRRKYYQEFSQKLSPATVTKFFQLEHRLDLLVDLSMAGELPMIMKAPSAPQNATPMCDPPDPG